MFSKESACLFLCSIFLLVMGSQSANAETLSVSRNVFSVNHSSPMAYSLSVKQSSLSTPTRLADISLQVSFPVSLVSLPLLIGNLVAMNDRYSPTTQMIWGSFSVAFSSLGLLWETFVSVLYLGSDFTGSWFLLSLPFLLIHLSSIIIGSINIHRARYRNSSKKRISVVPWFDFAAPHHGPTVGFSVAGRF